MTRRDRAALRLAYEALRDRSEVMRLHSARTALWNGSDGGLPQRIAAVIDGIRLEGIRHRRVVRARLALALRVLLRAEAGDFGVHVVCPCCGDRLPDDCEGGEGIMCFKSDSPAVQLAEVRSRYVPAWEVARR